MSPQKASGRSVKEAPVILGARIRSLRRARGMTLKALGEATGLTHAFLSQIERGLAYPSVTSLASIAAALGIGPGALMSGGSAEPVHITRRDGGPIVHEGRGSPGEVVGSENEASHLMRAMILEELPGSKRTHTGEELVHVIEGVVEVKVGDATYRLEPGDTLVFGATVPHEYRSLKGKQRLLLILADPGSPGR